MSARRLLTLAGTVLIALVGAPAALAAAPGSLDTSFGTGGIVGLPSGAQAYAVASTSGGGAVVAGSDANADLFAERLSASGSVVDSYHGTSGIAHGVAIAPNGNVVLAGTSNGAMIVQELSPTLGSSPVWSATAFAGQDAVANAVAMTPGGSVVAGGDANGQTAVAEFNSAGALAWTAAGFGSGPRESQINGLAVQPSGDIMAVGEQGGLQITNGLFAQLTGSGAVAHAGLVYYPASGFTTLTSAATEPNGEVIAAGLTEQPNTFAVRFTTAGGIDGSFGTSPGSGYPSIATVPSGENVQESDYPFGGYGVGIGGGGTILAAGDYENTGVVTDQALYAFTSSGQPDSALTGGQGTTSQGAGTVVGPDNTAEACGMAVDPTSGNVVAAGDTVSVFPVDNPCGLYSGPSSATQGYVARLIGFGPPPAGGGSPQPTGAAPAAVTGAAGQIAQHGAELTGQVDPNGLSTSYYFQYGTSTSYDPATASQSAGNGTALVGVRAMLTGLKPNTTYHYRLVARNADGTTYGGDATFRTPALAPAKFELKLGGIPKSYASSTVRKYGVRLFVSCSRACRFSGVATLSAAAAKALRLGNKAIKIGTLSGRMSRARRIRVRLKLTKAGSRLILRGAKLTVALNVIAQPLAGRGRAKASATLHFKR
jgi:hypothetical protein